RRRRGPDVPWTPRHGQADAAPVRRCPNLERKRHILSKMNVLHRPLGQSTWPTWGGSSTRSGRAWGARS
ncbi:hypothetical protein THAOC_29085, partial [Thalassiosira oceanica]